MHFESNERSESEADMDGRSAPKNRGDLELNARPTLI